MENIVISLLGRVYVSINIFIRSWECKVAGSSGLTKRLALCE